MNKRKTERYYPPDRKGVNAAPVLRLGGIKLNIMVYQVERKTDGTMGVEPIALYSRLVEARNHIGQLVKRGKEAFGMSIGPFKVTRI